MARKKRGKRRRRKKRVNKIYYDVWGKSLSYKTGKMCLNIFEEPDEIIMAKNPREAAKKAASFSSVISRKYYKFLGIKSSSKEAAYAVRASNKRSPRDLTFWK